MPPSPRRSRRERSPFSSSGRLPAASPHPLSSSPSGEGDRGCGPLGERETTAYGGALMRYMLLIYLDEQALSESERERCYRESTQLAHELSAAGQYLAAAPLEPTAAATSVRIRKGKRVVTDGPFAETKEQLGGYFLIDASDLDEAIAIAARIPMASRGTIEVRPVVHIPDLPAD